MNQNLASYYHERAKEYDKVYANPAEQADLQSASTLFKNLFAQKSVIEIACGTGYWTERIAQTAAAVLATDLNQSMIDIAQQKQLGPNTSFALADMYQFVPDKKYEALFGGFIWSHILLQDLDRLLQHLSGWLLPGSVMAFIDSKTVPNTSHDRQKITHQDEYGNTFQTRTLENGSTHQVLKNYPTRDFILQKFSPWASDIEFMELEFYWMVCCKKN
jgi:trans-aconitate methyltransferase